MESLHKSKLSLEDHSICTYRYQSLVVSLNCLTTCMQPYITTVVVFILAYSHNPSPEHIKRAIYNLCHACSVPFIGIKFSSSETNKPNSQIYHPFPQDKEYYIDVSSPTLALQHELTAYYDSCWGLQVESTMKYVTYL